MCTRTAFERLRDRISALEKSDAEQDASINFLLRGQKLQYWSIWGAFVLVLLALIYGALGPRGFNAVTKVAPPTAQCSPETN